MKLKQPRHHHLKTALGTYLLSRQVMIHEKHGMFPMPVRRFGQLPKTSLSGSKLGRAGLALAADVH